MQKNPVKNIVIISCLTVIMVFLVFKSAQYMWHYYQGPMHTIDSYVKALNKQEYEKIYSLLDQDTLKEINDKTIITQYYNRFYAKDNKLIHVSKVGWFNGKYILAYEFNGEIKKEALVLNKKSRGWRICFPFEFSEVQIIAPNGSEVSLGDVKLEYEPGIGYKREKLLPGKYMLKVELPHEADKAYYQMLQIPQTKKVVLPYALGQVQIICAPHLEVRLDKLSEISKQGIVQMPDILVGNYQLELVHPEGYLNPVNMSVRITEGNNTIDIEDYSLSKVGNTKWQQFLSDFYQSYKDAISKRTSEDLNPYFSQTQKEKQLDLFNAWYVAEKNIIGTDVSYKADSVTIDAEGRLHSRITETVELTNQEYDDLEQKQVNRHYKVMIKWQTVIDISTSEWKIVGRTIEESMIAFKDIEGKWIQY